MLAWLAVRSLRDQQFLLERQQSLLDQRVTDALAQNISDYLAQRQQEFSAQVESLAASRDAQSLAAQFDNQIRQRWPLAEVGFCVTLSGKILSPPPNARPAAQMFRLDNSDFLGNREAVEVYWNANNFNNANGNNGNAIITTSSLTRNSAAPSSSGFNGSVVNRLYPASPQTVTVVGGIAGQNQSQQVVALVAPAGAPPQERTAFASSARNGGQNSSPASQSPTFALNNSFGGGGGRGGGGVVSAAAVRADKINCFRHRRKPIPPTRFHNSGSKRPSPGRRNRMFRLPRPCRSSNKPRWIIRSR